jgi:hypothetical protein
VCLGIRKGSKKKWDFQQQGTLLPSQEDRGQGRMASTELTFRDLRGQKSESRKRWKVPRWSEHSSSAGPRRLGSLQWEGVGSDAAIDRQPFRTYPLVPGRLPFHLPQQRPVVSLRNSVTAQALMRFPNSSGTIAFFVSVGKKKKTEAVSPRSFFFSPSYWKNW